MNVLLAPFFEDNPYQKLLRKSVESADDDIETATHADPVPLSPLLAHLLWHRIDVLHLHWTHPYFLFGNRRELYRLPLNRLFCTVAAVVFVVQVMIASRLCDRVVWSVHNQCNHERRYERLDRWVSQQLVDIVDVVQVWDEQTRVELSTYLDRDLDHAIEIPHGNYEPEYDSEIESRDAAQEALGLDEYERVFLYFGLIRPYKNVPRLIDTFTEVAPDNTCLIVAGNPMHDEIERTVREFANGAPNVHIDLRYIPDEEVPRLFSACDFAVFPYDHIFNSGSVMLCMTFGRPFVAPAQGSLPSVAPDGNVLYESLDDGLRTAMSIPAEQIQTIGDRNYQIARSKYGWDDIGNDFVELYRAR